MGEVLSVGNTSYLYVLGVTKVKSRASCSLWFLNFRMLKITSIKGVRRYEGLNGSLSHDNARDLSVVV